MSTQMSKGMRMRRSVLCGLMLGLLGACSVWPVNQDPAGMEYRRQANLVINALQDYRHKTGTFPATLGMLMPTYLPEVPRLPDVRYSPADGSLRYAYIPSWPQLRPVRCASIGNTTEWHCAEHLDRPV
jgi:hypothetical protein